MGRSWCSMSSRAGHMIMETVFRQTVALRLGDGDKLCALESDTTGLNVKGNLYLYLCQLWERRNQELSWKRMYGLWKDVQLYVSA